ncbi:MAG: glycosyltransferase [Phormidium sp. PBR-2020]|nr:MAG: glycosyltransferase [Phormidium sp. PBR-2020]
MYANSLINLNVSLNDDINLRNLEVLASGGFLLTDKLRHQSGFNHLFEDGKHLVTYEDKQDLEDKIKYFLQNPTAAFDIATAGHQLFLEKHRPEIKVNELLNFINQQAPHPIYQHTIDRRSSYQQPKHPSQSAYRHRLSIHEYIQEKHRVIPKTVGIFDPNTPPELIADAADLSRLTLYWVQDCGQPPCQSLTESRQILENRDVLQYIQPIDSNRLSHELNQLEPETFRFAVFNIETTPLPEIQELSRRFQLNAFIFVKNGCERLSTDEQAQLQQALPAGQFSQDCHDPVVYRANRSSQPMPSQQLTQPLSPQQLTQLFQTYQQNPNDPNTLNALRQLRATVAQQWLNLPNDQLETHFNGQLGQLHKALWQSGLKNEPPTPDDQTTIAQLRQTLSQGLQAPGALQAFLCATLYGYPHQFNIQYHNAPIPNWMTELYLTYLFESPRLFKDLGEVDQYHQYFTDWTHYLQQKRLSQPDSPASQLLAKAYANLANLTPLCFSRRDSRRVQETRAALLEQYLEQQGAQLDYTFPPPARAATHPLRHPLPQHSPQCRNLHHPPRLPTPGPQPIPHLPLRPANHRPSLRTPLSRLRRPGSHPPRR